MNYLRRGSQVAVTACSDPYQKEYASKLNVLYQKFEELGWIPVTSAYLYEDSRSSIDAGRERAEELTSFFANDEIEAIFDISGGNLANEVIRWLDYDVIKAHQKPFFGYSDVTCVLNAMTQRTGMKTYLYQIRNLMYGCGEEQMKLVKESLCEGKDSLYDLPVEWIQGHEMEGVVAGGNIRCLLKLAGTSYFPDMKGKILALESYGGKPALLRSMLEQLKLMGVFDQIQGILLGTFTEMEQENYLPEIAKITADVVDDPKLPIAKTKWFGHGIDSMCIRIGEYQKFSESIIA